MNILKSLNFNVRSKYIINNSFYNLNRKQSKYIFLLSWYISNMNRNKCNEPMEQDPDCYIVGVTKLNDDNNASVSTTAHGAPGFGTRFVYTHNSNNIRIICEGRGRNNSSNGSTNQQGSTSMGKQNSHRPNYPNLLVNPNCTEYFKSCQSFFHLRGLAQPYSNNFEQHANYSTQRFRNLSLFSEERSSSSDSHIHYNTRENATQLEEDRERINNLRTWIDVNKNSARSNNTPGITFTLMSYNVLAQDLIVEHQYLYRKHQPRALLWEYRWKKLFEEIKMHNADIICLQEVQEDHLQNYFSQLFKKGYAHLYKKRTGMRTDGCAIYYKTSVFKLIENTTVEYNQDFPTLDRDNVAIIAKFVPVSNPQAAIVVATTHLLYNPRRQDVRLAQTQVLLAEVDRIAFTGGERNKYTPVIITGDFNSQPDSAVYKLLANGTLRYDNLSNKTLTPTNSSEGLEGKVLIPSSLRITDNCQHLDLLEHRSVGAHLLRKDELQLIQLKHSRRPKSQVSKVSGNDTLFSTGVLRHDLNLKSAFLHQIGNDTEGTTDQNEWITVDYIFYSGRFNTTKKKVTEDKLKLLSRYSIPTTVEYKNLPKKLRLIPNLYIGSDHLALLTKFKLNY